MQDRRTAERIRINLAARWEGLMTAVRGAVCDLSLTGCFILTAGQVETGELVRLELHFADRVNQVWGEVVYGIAEMGFAMRFAFANADEELALASSIESIQ
jgi:hypothetical protein